MADHASRLGQHLGAQAVGMVDNDLKSTTGVDQVDEF